MINQFVRFSHRDKPNVLDTLNGQWVESKDHEPLTDEEKAQLATTIQSAIEPISQNIDVKIEILCAQVRRLRQAQLTQSQENTDND